MIRASAVPPWPRRQWKNFSLPGGDPLGAGRVATGVAPGVVGAEASHLSVGKGAIVRAGTAGLYTAADSFF